MGASPPGGAVPQFPHSAARGITSGGVRWKRLERRRTQAAGVGVRRVPRGLALVSRVVGHRSLEVPAWGVHPKMCPCAPLQHSLIHTVRRWLSQVMVTGEPHGISAYSPHCPQPAHQPSHHVPGPWQLHDPGCPPWGHGAGRGSHSTAASLYPWPGHCWGLPGHPCLDTTPWLAGLGVGGPQRQSCLGEGIAVKHHQSWSHGMAGGTQGPPLHPCLIPPASASGCCPKQELSHS